MGNLGFEPHVWQQHRADVMYELEPCDNGRRLMARVAGTMVGRQGGKTAAAGGDVTLRLMAPSLPEVRLLVGHEIGPQHVVFTAQDRQSALYQWQAHVDLIMSSPYAKHVRNGKPTMTHGSECLRMDNGSQYEIVTPSKDGARGKSIDLAIIDEALTHEAWLLDALQPTMAQRDGARSSFGAQLVVISNAGDETAELLNLQRELGRRAVLEGDRRRMWLEYSCSEDDDPLDPATWARVIPTYEQPDGISRDMLEMAAETLGTDAFAREYLCRTVMSTVRQVISPDVWDRLPRLDLTAGPGAVIAVECTDDRASTSVVAARLMGDRVAVELLEQRPGTDWVVDYVTNLAVGHGARVAIDPYGPAAPLVPMLKRAGARIAKIGARDIPDGAGWFVDAVNAARIGHMGDDRFLNAVAVLARRKRGDRWVFDRDRAGDVTPIIAASLAVWLVDSRPAHKPAIHAGQ
jgi:hypothetical protein